VETETYGEQRKRLPAEGNVLVAHFDDETVVVYQAYRDAIARYALEYQRFGGEAFSFTRMSWIKPSFLWMTYRAGWATKSDQERVLAVRIERAFFDECVRDAVPARFDASAHTDLDGRRADIARSRIRVQWDPDRTPRSTPLRRRAIQLGLRREVLRRYADESIREITDITPFVVEQRERLGDAPDDEILVPVQRVYEGTTGP